MIKQVSQHEAQEAFLRAVCSYQGSKARWIKRAQTGLDDEALKAALKYELGTFGDQEADIHSISLIRATGLKYGRDHTALIPAQMPQFLKGHKPSKWRGICLK